MEDFRMWQDEEIENSLKGEVIGGDGVYCWSGKRPKFSDWVTNKVFPKTQDRCHSASWEMLSGITTDILTCGNMGRETVYAAKDGIQFLTNTMLGLNQLNKDIKKEDKERYGTELKQVTKTLIDACINERYIEKSATAYLRTLNSCICNLRYEAEPKYNWNQSVQGGYDVRKWCFVNAALLVTSDETGVRNPALPIRAYQELANKPVPVGPGFYLTDSFDEYLLGRLFDTQITSMLLRVHLYICHGVDADGNAVVMSSSNAFPIGAYTADPYSAYFKRGDVWQAF